MFGLGHLTRSQRLVLGICILLLVDVIWVISSEITEYIFPSKHYDKPYFCTYLSTSMFVFYLAGFLIWRSWWLQCRKNNGKLLESDSKEEKFDNDKLISEPIYVPVKYDDRSNSGTDSDDLTSLKEVRAVRFSNLSEVRMLTDEQAEDAALARLSYCAYMRAREAKLRAASKLSVKQIAKVAFIFCVIFFFCQLAYQEAYSGLQTGLVHVLSSTSGLFTLVLAAIFPSSSSDRITLSKLVAVGGSIGGVVLVSFSNHEIESEIPLAALWALLGALLYAIYLVLLRRRVDNEDKLNMPMFLGFVGFFATLFFWPGFFIVHATRAETFEWPTTIQWIFLITNGLIGTVVSELLWLWGCFLTSTLVATLALSLIIPMRLIADLCIKQVSYNWMFYAGICPVFLAFFMVSLLCYYDNWDPVWMGLKKCLNFVCRRRIVTRLREMDREQAESLISIHSDHSDT